MKAIEYPSLLDMKTAYTRRLQQMGNFFSSLFKEAKNWIEAEVRIRLFKPFMVVIYFFIYQRLYNFVCVGCSENVTLILVSLIFNVISEDHYSVLISVSGMDSAPISVELKLLC